MTVGPIDLYVEGDTDPCFICEMPGTTFMRRRETITEADFLAYSKNRHAPTPRVGDRMVRRVCKREISRLQQQGWEIVT